MWRRLGEPPLVFGRLVRAFFKLVHLIIANSRRSIRYISADVRLGGGPTVTYNEASSGSYVQKH